MNEVAASFTDVPVHSRDSRFSQPKGLAHEGSFPFSEKGSLRTGMRVPRICYALQ